MVRTAFFASAAFLVLCFGAVSSAPAFAQAVGNACTGTNRIYTQESPTNDSLICNGSTLLLELLQSSKAGPPRRGIATGSPQDTLDVNGEIRMGNTGISCSSTIAGALRYNPVSKLHEYCNGVNWTSLVPGCNAYPDDFIFANVTGATGGSATTSSIQKMTGIACGTADVTITGGGTPQFRTCSDATCTTVVQNWTSTATDIANNNYLQLRLTASTTSLGILTATVTVGGQTKSWSVTTADAATYKLVFVDTIGHGNFNGVAGADAFCASEASAAGLGGTFKAWLASSTADDPATRFTRAAVPYKEVEGTTIANNWTDLTDGTLIAGITKDRYGAGFYSTAAVWTNVGDDGTADTGFSNGMNAVDLLGEYTSQTSSATVVWTKADYNDGPDQLGYNGPQDMALDSTNHRLFVADPNNARVLEYNLNTDNTLPDKVPDKVLGQANFTSNVIATTQAGMKRPVSLAFDATNNRLFVGESSNIRVLVFNTATITNGMNAANVLGQANFTSSVSATTQAGMKYPSGLAFDATNNRLFVADANNVRVLVYDTTTITNGENAVNVLGQANFTTATAATTQAGMNSPQRLAFDATNNLLFVADNQNNRVLVFNTATITDGMNATDVLGQASYTATGTNNLGFSGANGVALDATNHRLFVADTNNNRVLEYNLNTDNTLPDKVPDRVLGQSDFVSNVAATTQAGMKLPYAPAFDATNNRLFVVDYGNNRVLVFNTSTITDGMNAANVLGQAIFTTATAATTQAGMNSPLGQAFDATNNRLFVSNWNNNRVLVYNTSTITDGENAVNVLGQANFTTGTSATTQAGMTNPRGLAFDATNNRLFVSDYSNKRVLVFDTATITDGENAVNVLGQANFTSKVSATTQAGMSSPFNPAFDATNNRLFVSDYGNNRVLVFDTATITDGENAVNVLGQANFTTATAATTQAGMNSPQGLAFDGTNNRLFVVEYGNNRVMIFATASITNGENASDELGEYASATSSATVVWTKGGTNNSPNDSAFSSPTGLAFDDTNNRLFVSDNANSRVLVFNLNANGTFPDKVADYVLGKADFVSATKATTQAGIRNPIGLTFDATNNRLFVADGSNNRVMIFGTASITNGENASDELGQYDSQSSSATVVWTKGAANNGAGLLGYDEPQGITLDAVNHRLFVSDSANNRVLEYNLNTDNTLPDKVPDRVLGQPDFMSPNYGLTQSTMFWPTALAVDGANNRLFVVDTYNNRVLVFNTSTITNGMNAANVLGQANFTSDGSATTQAGMTNPRGLAFDATNNRLFVSDYSNKRVLVFDTATITDGENAVNVLGEPDFTSVSTTMTQALMAGPYGLAVDAANNRLFVADAWGCRVLVYDTATITNGENAVNVLGEPDFVTCNYATTRNGLTTPFGLAFDPATKRLFVADGDSERIMIWNTATITNGMNATSVLGQTSFTAGVQAVTQKNFSYYWEGEGLYFDPTTSRLYFADSAANRIMIFDGPINNCTNWTVDGSSTSGAMGGWGATNSTWTDNGSYACDYYLGEILCFQQ